MLITRTHVATSACLDSTLASVFWRLGDGPTVATATVGVDSIGVPRAVVAAVVVGRAVESVARTWVEGGHHDGGGDDHGGDGDGDGDLYLSTPAADAITVRREEVSS